MKHNLSIALLTVIISMYSIMGFSKASEGISFLKSTQPTKNKLIIVSANWCLPCKVVHKWLEEDKIIKNLLENYQVEHYDFDVDKEAVKKYNVDRIPFFAVVKGKKELARKIGIGSGKKGLESFLQTYK